MADIPRDLKAPLEEHERQRAILDQHLEELATLIILSSGDDGTDDDRANVIARRAAKTAYRAAVAGLILADIDLEKKDYDEKLGSAYDAAVSDVADTAVEAVRQVAREAHDRVALMEQPERRAWARTAGQNVASRVAGQMAMQMAAPISAALGVPLRKLWISRGDQKVRELHRHLHGDTKAIDAPFWRSLEGAGELQYPGDTSAPFEAWINCRCGLFLVPGPASQVAEQVFHMENEDFDALAASAGIPHPYDQGAITDLRRAAAR